MEDVERVVRKFAEFGELSAPLSEDLEICTDNLKKEDSQFWRRALVRTFFAKVEGDSYQMCRHALLMHQYFDAELTAAEEAIIRQESYDLRKNGKVKARPQYNSIDRLLRFALRIYTKAFGADLEVDVGKDHRWSAFKTTIKLRNRLTHPKGRQDMEITDSELDTTIAACGWYLEAVGKALNSVHNALKERPVVIDKST